MSIFRLIQGVGAAAIFPNALVLATGTFPSEHRGKAMGIWAMGISLGSVTGPTLGGVIIDFMGWRSVFFVNIFFIVVSLVCILFLVRTEDRKRDASGEFDYWGTVILAVMIVSLVTSMVNGPETGWMSFGVMVTVAMVLVSIPLFFKLERAHSNPLIHPDLFGNRVFMTGVLCGGVHLVAIQGTNFLMPLFLSQVHGMHALAIGLLMLPQAAVRFVVSPLAGSMADRFGNRIPVTLGLIIRTAAMASLALLSAESTPLHIAACLVLDGTGAALIWAPSLNASIESCPPSMAGSAAGVFNMLRFVMGVIGTVSVGVVLDMFFVAIPGAGPVPGFMHAYLALGTLTAISLTQVRHLEQEDKGATGHARSDSEAGSDE